VLLNQNLESKKTHEIQHYFSFFFNFFWYISILCTVRNILLQENEKITNIILGLQV